MKHDVQVFRQRKRIQLLWLASPFLASVLVLAEPMWATGDVRNEIIRQLGTLAIIICIAGRCWAALHIGGQKNQQLITSGPYARTRNPLYFFSSVGLAGVGLAFGSMTLGIVFFVFSYLSFSYVIRREELALEQFFQEEYGAYVGSVPRFFPSLAGIPAEPPANEKQMYRPFALHKTFWQALLFLLAIPLHILIERLHSASVIQPIIKLY